MEILVILKTNIGTNVKHNLTEHNKFRIREFVYLPLYRYVIVYVLKYFANISKVTQKKEHQVQNRALINLNKQLAEKLLYYKSFKTQFDKNCHLDIYL